MVYDTTNQLPFDVCTACYYTYFLFPSRKLVRNARVTVLGSCDLFSEPQLTLQLVFVREKISNAVDKKNEARQNSEFLITPS